MAKQAERSWLLWGVAGALFALVTTTIVLGLTTAIFIPFSIHEAALFHLRAVGVSIAIILVLGWAFTLGLHNQHRRIVSACRAMKQGKSPAPPEKK